MTQINEDAIEEEKSKKNKTSIEELDALADKPPQKVHSTKIASDLGYS